MPQGIACKGWGPVTATLCTVVVVFSPFNDIVADDGHRIGKSIEATQQRLESAEAESLNKKRLKPSDSKSRNRTTRKSSRGQRKLQIVHRGTSSKAVREAAVAQLPLDKLTPEGRDRVEQLLQSQSLFRRLPTISLPVDHKAYRFFARHPEVAVSIWRVMKISKCKMWQTAANAYQMDVGDGSAGVVDALYRSANQNLIVCDGMFAGPLLVKPFTAKAVIHLQSRFSQSENGQPYVTHTADLFVCFPSQTIETAAKLISPISNLIADRNFNEISLFLQMISQAMQKQPGWVEQVADRMDGILPIREHELLRVTARVYIASRKRELITSNGSKPLTLDEIRAPLLEAANRSTATEFEASIGQPHSKSVVSDVRPGPSDELDSIVIRSGITDGTAETSSPMGPMHR